MNSAERRARMIFHAGNRAAALAVSACLLVLFGLGIGGVPALGRLLVPGHGGWRSPAAASPPVAQTLTLPGLAGTYLPMPAASGIAGGSSVAVNWGLRP